MTLQPGLALSTVDRFGYWPGLYQLAFVRE